MRLAGRHQDRVLTRLGHNMGDHEYLEPTRATVANAEILVYKTNVLEYTYITISRTMGCNLVVITHGVLSTLGTPRTSEALEAGSELRFCKTWQLLEVSQLKQQARTIVGASGVGADMSSRLSYE